MTDQENTSDQFRITRVWAKNFRSIRELDIELGPLTVLVGPNASGKSNVMDVLRFIRDCAVSGLDRAISDRSGINEIRRWSAKGTARNIEVGLEASMGRLQLGYGLAISGRREGDYKIRSEIFRFEDASTGKIDRLEVRNGKIVKPKLDAATDSFDFSQLMLTNLTVRSAVFEYLGGGSF